MLNEVIVFDWTTLCQYLFLSINNGFFKKTDSSDDSWTYLSLGHSILCDRPVALDCSWLQSSSHTEPDLSQTSRAAAAFTVCLPVPLPLHEIETPLPAILHACGSRLLGWAVLTSAHPVHHCSPASAPLTTISS